MEGSELATEQTLAQVIRVLVAKEVRKQIQDVEQAKADAVRTERMIAERAVMHAERMEQRTIELEGQLAASEFPRPCACGYSGPWMFCPWWGERLRR